MDTQSALKEDLKRTLKEVGEKRLRDFRTQMGEKFKESTRTREKITTGYHNFKLQLITLSGGTISIFVALQGKEPVELLIKLGFSVLGFSLLCGIISIFLSLAGEEDMWVLREEFDLSGRKMSLEFMEKFDGIDASMDKEMQRHEKTIIKQEKDRLNQRYGKIKSLMKFFHLDAQKIDDGQLVFFLVGILLIILGLFT